MTGHLGSYRQKLQLQQKIIQVSIILTVAWFFLGLGTAAAQSPGFTVERVSLFVSDGVLAEEIRQIPAPSSTPAPLNNGLTLVRVESTSAGAGVVQWK